MSSLNDIRKNRLKKLKAIKEVGIDPYPAKVRRTMTNAQALTLALKERPGQEIILVGRIVSIREHGGACFSHIEDGTAKIQLYLKRDVLDDKAYQFFLANFDIGDFIEAQGILFKTKTGETTLEVRTIKILTKALRPLPEKWHGFKDIEERFRKRYLDLLMNSAVRDNFLLRSQMIKAIRQFLDKNFFVEVETPILQVLPGGATARPFRTHLNALGLDLYLRVAPELYLKRLLVGGFERVYEIGRCFRNEGMDFSHNPDFTMLELYAAYWDYERLMEFSEELFSFMLKKTKIGLKTQYHKQDVKWKTPWPRVEFSKLAKNDEEFKEARQKIIQPTFVINHPLVISPLAKRLDKDSEKVARFQLVAAGIEIVNGFSELNDPQDQEQRFLAQEKLRAKGDEEAQRMDADFIEALEYGMPPAAGLGIGIDRLVALLTNSHSLREVILFPTMKPKEKSNLKSQKSKSYT